MNRYVVGLGSNLGSRMALLRAASARLGGKESIVVEAVSRARASEALVRPGDPPGPLFFNAALVLRTDLRPSELMPVLWSVEAELGRVRGSRWAARTIDLDILLWSGAPMTEPQLTIPHRELASRPFAQATAADLGPIPGIAPLGAVAVAVAVKELPAPTQPATFQHPSPKLRYVAAYDTEDALALAMSVDVPSEPFVPCSAPNAAEFVAAAADHGACAAVIFQLANGVHGALARGPRPGPRFVIGGVRPGECLLERVE